MTDDALPGSDLYDDPSFFAQYQLMRATRAGLNEELEQPALARMLPPMHGASVIELGCGGGTLARRLASAGAADVLAVDSARRMLAARRLPPSSASALPPRRHRNPAPACRNPRTASSAASRCTTSATTRDSSTG